MKTIIAHPKFDYLADRIALNNPTQIQKWTVDFNIFPDKTPNLFAKRVNEVIEHKEVTYLWDFSNMSDIFTNLAVIRWILDYYPNKLRIFMPYFPVWTMERIEKKWEIATAKYFAELFNYLPSWRSWKTSIHIFDIHALVERFLFDSRAIDAELHTAMSLLKEELKGKTIVFPDDGAKKRFWSDFEWFDSVVCLKTREWDKRIIKVSEGNPNWKDLVIIDDLIQSWWTIKETATKLRELWAKSVSAFATHWVFPNDSHISLAWSLDELIVTDSIPENISRAETLKNMRVVSIAPLVEKIILR